jgi:hypothetical protein
MPILHPGKRLRRDARAMEEEEEIWFEGDDDFEESDNMLPISEVLKPKSDFVFDHINRFLERKSIVSHCKYITFKVCKFITVKPILARCQIFT